MAVYIVKISSNGQVSIPAEIRRRWAATRVAVVDNGNSITVQPVPEDPISAFRGSWAKSRLTSEEMRRDERAAERRRERARR